MKYILFWSTYDKEKDRSIKNWKTKDIELSPFHKLTLASYIKHGLDVNLYTYQNINSPNIPKGINLFDADELLPRIEAFNALEQDHSIAIVSDCVRINAACKLNGIIIDMDAIILKPFPEIGSFYSSMPAKRTGGFAPKWGSAHPPMKVWDNSWDGKALTAFPVKVGNSNRDNMEKLARHIRIMLNNPPKKSDWTSILWTIKKFINHDNEAEVYSPIYNCPVPSWLHKGKCYSLESPSRLDGKTQLFGHTLPSHEEIFNNTYVVQHFFESAFSESKTVDEDFWATVPEDCFLAKEANHILGDNWKMILNES